MAKKVETIKYEYRNRKGIVEMPVDVMLSADMTFYYSKKSITQEILNFFPRVYDYGKDQIYFSTFRELKDSIKTLLNQFEKSQIEVVKEKIIVYKMQLNGNLTPHLYSDQRGARQFTDLERDADSLLGLALEWDLGWKCKSGKTVTYHLHDVNDSGPDADGQEVVGREFEYHKNPENKDRGRHFMPWTPEREQWFKNLEETLRQMVSNVDKFFNKQKPKQLIEIIDQNQILRLGGGKNET